MEASSQNEYVSVSLWQYLNAIYRHLDFFFFFCLLGAVPMAYGGSQARGLIGAVAAGLRHSHGNSGFLTHREKPGIESTTSWFPVGFTSTVPRRELLNLFSC